SHRGVRGSCGACLRCGKAGPATVLRMADALGELSSQVARSCQIPPITAAINMSQPRNHLFALRRDTEDHERTDVVWSRMVYRIAEEVGFLEDRCRMPIEVVAELFADKAEQLRR